MAEDPLSEYNSLRREIASGNLAPVYILHGEEGFFIDELVKALEGSMPDSDKEFNMAIFYGADTSVPEVIHRCQSYPFGGDRTIVILKEAQVMDARQLARFTAYLQNPMPSTTLAIIYRNKPLKSKELFQSATAIRGRVYESKPLKDKGVQNVLARMCADKGLNIEPKGLEMLCEYVGNDLSKLYNQVSKLTVALERGATITPEVIERNVGVSKEYNVFELTDAIVARNAAKAIKIVEHFRSNPKNNPAIPVVAAIFSKFSDVMVYHFMRDKSPAAVMSALGLKWPRQVSAIEGMARSYNARRTIEIISLLRDADCQMKGIGSRQNEYDILRNLIFAIFNCRGI